jgi:rifampicin phosphotransferase
MMEIYDLFDIPDSRLQVAGGKARGLNALHRAGLTVAKGFVILGVESSQDVAAAADYYESCGFGPVAVRSSAAAEDGAEYSNAGQYSTYLNVSGRQEVEKAILSCLQSLGNEVAASYANHFGEAKSDAMAVIVQQMVDADKAGVCFTSDPLSGSSHMLVEAVADLGEKLVSGTAAAEQYRVRRTATAQLEIPEVKDGLLASLEIESICTQAEAASKYLDMPLDTEWAIGADGRLYWLQARPITTLEECPVDEFDTKLPIQNQVITHCNIGEMLPGAVTPLSLSTSVEAIDYGMRRMFVTIGAFKSYDDVPPTSCALSTSGHLFLNLSTMYKICESVIGADPRSIELSLCGKLLQDTPDPCIAKKSALVRVFNGMKYFRFLLSRKKAAKKLRKFSSRFEIAEAGSSAAQYALIDEAMPALREGFWYHYITSGFSGSMGSALFLILKDDFPDEESAKSALASVYEDIDGIESVDILRSLRALARAVLVEYPDAASWSQEQLASCIKASSGDIRTAYDYFIERHGHRAIREAEISSLSWHADEKGLMDYLRTVLVSGGTEPSHERTADHNIRDLLSRYKGIKRSALKYIISQARAGVKLREYTKSLCIKVTDRFKDAYARLAQILVSEGVLPDAGLIYFLQHDEIGLLISGQTKYVKKALARRRILEEQKPLRFNDISVGKPKAVEMDLHRAAAGTTLSGTPVSRGRATGRARVVRSVVEANLLEKGEIMVSAYTDIGWSPYYCLIGALITEVGSALSHGAVVAREYALPLVANVSYATELIRTGDMVFVDGTTGEVRILD